MRHTRHKSIRASPPVVKFVDARKERQDGTPAFVEEPV